MALSKRLLALFQMVDPNSIVADIGCDHGQLSIALVEEGICDHVYACDLRAGPLSRAKEAVMQAHLETKIDCLLRNGMDDLPDDCDTILIAGMGFETIKQILEAHETTLPHYRKFIIQSNKHVAALRHWISAHHFTIVQEDLVEEDHFYEIVAFTCEYHDSYSEVECMFGIDQPKHPLFQRYLRHKLAKQQQILAKMPKDHARRSEMECYEKKLKQQLEKDTSH